MQFKYLRDPLFLTCFVAYFVNRWLLKPLFVGGFFHNSFNDLICIPFWVPMMLWTMRKIGARRDDAPPRFHEILLPLLVWSAVFEIYLPRLPAFSHLAHADANDIAFYALGALSAALFWQFYYARDKSQNYMASTRKSAAAKRANS